MDTTSEAGEQRVYHGKTAYLTIIFSRWRKLHIFTLVIELFAAFTACFTFVVFYDKFNHKCALFADLVIARVPEQQNSSLAFIVILEESSVYLETYTHWGSHDICRFVMYVPLINMIGAISWILLFSINGTYSPNSQRKLEPSTCISGFILTIISHAGAIVLTRGGNILCESFNETELKRCKTAQSINWINFPQLYGFYDYLLRCKIASWVSAHTWLFHSLISLIRWTTRADYVIAEERELKEEASDIFAIFPVASTKKKSDDSEENDEVEDDAEDDATEDGEKGVVNDDGEDNAKEIKVKKD